LRSLVLATQNQGKIAEFERLLEEHAGDIKVLGLSDFPDMPDVIESGKTLSENAFLKARAIAEFAKLPALADDSGLFVDYLDGKPGVYSARFGGYEGKDAKERDLININKLLTALKDVPSEKRGAQFKCVVAFVNPAKDFEHEEIGELPGMIAVQPAGDDGFGYDPIFIPKDFDQSLAQLGAGVKDRISHRGQALRSIAPILNQHL
jgi:XTP/dITP diphosphohydrolase